MEVIFLIILGFIWITFASIQDLKKREVADWLNFSLIIFALGFRFFYSLFFLDFQFNFFYQGLIGFGVFLVIGNLFYYARVFAGGDAKLMIALGAVLPFSNNIFMNFKIFIWFLFLFLFVGTFYSLIISLVYCGKNFRKFKKEFLKQFKKKRKIFYLFMFLGSIVIFFGIFENILFFFGLILFSLPYFFIYAKTIDEVCMIKEIETNKLSEGDWLYNNLKIKNKLLKPNWEGLSKKEIREIKKKYKKVRIRQGIPFVPVFWFSFIILALVYFLGLIDLFRFF